MGASGTRTIWEVQTGFERVCADTKPESVSAVVSASAHDLSNPDFITDDHINNSETSDSQPVQFRISIVQFLYIYFCTSFPWI